MLLWTISILWEFVELSTTYFVPNFAECWWDQWLLDVAICNGLGIEFGLWFLKAYEVETPRYDWVPFMNIETMGDKIKRSIAQFSQPENWIKPTWEKRAIWV